MAGDMMHPKIGSKQPWLVNGNLTRWIANTPNCQFFVDRVIWPNRRWQWLATGVHVAERKVFGPIQGKDAIEVARMLNLREADGKLIRFNQFSYI